MAHKLAILSVHTSPLAQPGVRDGGGMNVYVRALGTALARAGVPCDIFTRAEHPAQAPFVELERGCRVFQVGAGPRSSLTKEALAGMVDELAEGFRDALLATGEDYFALHGNYWLSGAVAHQLKHELAMPMVSTFHTLERVKGPAMSSALDVVRATTEEAVVRCSDLVLASTSDEVAQLANLYGADVDRVEELPLGVDHGLFSPGDRDVARSALGLPVGRPIVLFVGRIQPLKGLDLAVEALAALGDHEALLVAVGGPSGPDGELELARVRQRAQDLGLAGQVAWVPPTRHERLVDYYRAADVCLVPSRSESFGLVALEAAASGTPVVAAAVGGLRSIVDDGSTGLLVDGREPQRFAGAIATILDDPELSRWMASNAAAASRRFSWTMTAARLRRLLADLDARAPLRCR